MKIDLLLWGHTKLYAFIFVVLFVLELIYFRIANKCNIIDKPNERSSHSSVVLRGGGIIFSLGLIVWVLIFGVYWNNWPIVLGYLPFIIGLLIVTVVSFWDDVKPLPDMVRLCAHFIAIVLMFYNWGVLHFEFWYILLFASIVSVGMINVYNFMDGINGITGGYSLVVLGSLVILNSPNHFHIEINGYNEFMRYSYLGAIIVAVVVFCLFNFRSKGKAKCFAGDVGSVSIAYMILFPCGKLLQCTGDFTYMVILVVYGVDACLTIVHRIMLHENLGQAHRKHVYQIMANELKMGHVQVSLIYMAIQAVISFVFIFIVPNDHLSHWLYLIGVLLLLTIAYVVFMKKYYHLHEEYLASLREVKTQNDKVTTD